MALDSGYWETEENERCEDCTFYFALKHNFKRGEGFEYSHCCAFFPLIEREGFAMETGPNARCEVFTRRADDATD